MNKRIENIKKFIKEQTDLDVNLDGVTNGIDIQLEAAQCGAAAPMFKKIRLMIGFYTFDTNCWRLTFHYVYDHFYGSNGHVEHFESEDDCETFVRTMS